MHDIERAKSYHKNGFDCEMQWVETKIIQSSYFKVVKQAHISPSDTIRPR